METQENQETHSVLGGRAYIFKRDRSSYWQAGAFLNGHTYRHTTKEKEVSDAIQAAEEWYISLRGRQSMGALPAPSESEEREPTFRDVAEQFMKEYAVLTEGQRSPKWIEGHNIRLRVHLYPFFGELPISEIDSAKILEYRVKRMTPLVEKNPHALDNRPFKAKTPAPKTLHNEIVTLRMVLKAALRRRLIEGLPDLSSPFRRNGKISHRPWFSLAEYKQLYTATRENAKTAREQDKWFAEQMHDYVLFLANTGLRPDEAANLQHRDIEIVDDDDTEETLLVIEVRGKRGVGYCKSTPNAVRPYLRLRNRAKPVGILDRDELPAKILEPQLPQPEDHVFPSNHVRAFNRLLLLKKLKFDRDGQARTAYSLRHSYICMRLMEGADVYQLAKNCRTSVEMIEKHYAAHIKHLLDAGLINTRKPRKSKPRFAEDEDL
jgi:integrase